MTANATPDAGQQGPELIWQMQFSFTASRVLTAGVQLGIFDCLARAGNSANGVAADLGTDPRGTRMLLDALVALGLLAKPAGRYALSPLAERFLVRDSVDYVGGVLETDTIYENWAGLVPAVRSGRPVQRVEQKEKAEAFFPILVRSLHVMAREPARRMAEALGAGTRERGLHVLDVACGSGVWGIAVAEADGEARIVAQDFPGVLETTRQYYNKHGIAERCAFLPGDLRTVDFGTARYDLALLGNIVHSEGETASQALFRRLFQALKPGGRIVVLDMVPNDERTGPPFPVLFALNMLVNTAEGDTYTFAQYRDWLGAAGFFAVEAVDIGSHSPMVVAVKKAT